MVKYRSTLAIIMLVAMFGLHETGVPVPKRPPGFVYRESEVNAMVPVQIENFIDLICKDARKAFPVLRDVAELYGPDRVKLSTVMFPLPYHPHAFYASAAAFYVNKNKPDSTYEFIQAVFDKYELINSHVQYNSSSENTVRILGQIASDYGVPVADLMEEIDPRGDGDSLKDAVHEWKYGTSRGAFGTPNVFVNGVFVTNNQSWSVKDWKDYLDPMVYV